MALSFLEDPDFWAEVGSPTLALAEQFGSSVREMEVYRRKGLTLRRWSPVEDWVLSEFYSDYPVSCIAMALARTKDSVYCRAHELGLQGRHQKRSERCFWLDYREFLLENLEELEALDREALCCLTWDPPHPEWTCESCPERENCDSRADRLPCERLLLCDALGLSPSLR